jgi:hypothetical protein
MDSNDEKSEEFVMYYLQYYRYYGFNLTLNQNMQMRFSRWFAQFCIFLQCQHAKNTQTWNKVWQKYETKFLYISALGLSCFSCAGKNSQVNAAASFLRKHAQRKDE